MAHKVSKIPRIQYATDTGPEVTRTIVTYPADKPQSITYNGVVFVPKAQPDEPFDPEGGDLLECLSSDAYWLEAGDVVLITDEGSAVLLYSPGDDGFMGGEYKNELSNIVDQPECWRFITRHELAQKWLSEKR